MLSRLFQRRNIWWPTWAGWLLLLVLGATPAIFWCFAAESFLSLTDRQPAEVLVVEGWIGFDGLRAAREEFEQGGYRYVVTVGALTSDRWTVRRWNYATEARKRFVRDGLPPDRVIEAPAAETEAQRTFATALAARRALEAHGLHPAAVNVFTLGAHARRSRLIFAKVLPATTKVGCISWLPPEYRHESWWQSSERAQDLIKESVGYTFELLLNSGRLSNGP